MDFYQHAPRTPHHSRMGSGAENLTTALRPPPTISFENNKINTPFPSKTANGNVNNTPFPAKTGLGGVKTGLQPRRALADISNANANNNNQNAAAPSAVKGVAPKTVTKTAVKKPLSVKSVRFDDDVETCTRISKFRATPFKPEVEQLAKSVSLNWYQDYVASGQDETRSSPRKEVTFAEFSVYAADDEETTVVPSIPNSDDDDLSELLLI